MMGESLHFRAGRPRQARVEKARVSNLSVVSSPLQPASEAGREHACFLQALLFINEDT